MICSSCDLLRCVAALRVMECAGPVDGAWELTEVFVSWLLDSCTLPADGWLAFGRYDEDRTAYLQVLTAMAASSKVTKVVIGCTVQWAALRLASWDFNEIPKKAAWSARRKNRFMVRVCMEARVQFCCSAI